MWIALVLAAGFLVLLAVAGVVGLVSQVEDWSRDLSTNVAATQENAADERLRPFHSALPPKELADRTEAAAAGLPGWTLARRESEPAGEVLHFVRTTPLLRFQDDIRIRIEPGADGSVLTAESRSRIGKGDLGQNPRNLRELLSAVRGATEPPP